MLNDIRKNPNVSAGNMFAYPAPTATLTPAPKGYKPVYMSHYGRHGSRHLIDPKDYQAPLKTLQHADSLGKLSDKGKDVMRIVALLEADSRNRYGELTPLGALQHRGIAERMIKNFPEIFSGKAYVNARSTTVIRCILSMENALQQLVSINPELQVRHDASVHDMYFMNADANDIKKQRLSGDAGKDFGAFCAKHGGNPSVVNVLFNDSKYVSESVDANRLASQLFTLAGVIQDTELRGKVSLYDLFTPEDMYQRWHGGNAWWYSTHSASRMSGGIQQYTQNNLLRRIISEADSCLRLSNHGATLRFGHDGNVMPLYSLLEINNGALDVESLDQLEAGEWLDYRIIPMASNIQIIFYRSIDSYAPVLVKVLFNEKEAVLPVKTDCAPYYRWSDVRRYYITKMNNFDIKQKYKNKK